jgi:para-aminobenzoate synthetase/4-amino-4-deoxychorismate lyase
METRPMKGTRRRGPTLDADDRLASELVRSAKDRAENVMITDMARNDLGRVAVPGSVQVTALCALERYPTVWQLTSTVRGSAAAPVPACLGALFPAASITGAPKVRAMELIAELEREPRGVYTGSVGVWGPGPLVEFSVAIRTVSIDARAGEAVYGTGGGIVWDSRPRAERAEAGWKSRVLVPRPRRFQLLETLLWEAGAGYLLVERHLARICGSAAYFAFPADEEEIRRRLRRAERGWRRAEVPVRRNSQARVVRLRLDAAGGIRISSAPAPVPSERPWRVALAARPVDPRDPFLFHKTTRRALYDAARRGRPDCEDVLLWNRRGEVTESTIANLAVELDGEWITPALACGLLPGTMRAELLERGEIREGIVCREDLARAGEIRLLNSVRRWIPAVLAPDAVAGDDHVRIGEACGRRDRRRLRTMPGPAPAPRSDSRSAILGQ